MSLQSQLARLLVGVLAIVIALTFAASPALAAPPPKPAPAAGAAAVPGPVLAQAKPAATAPPAEAPAAKPFLKTTRGAITLALFAGAVGFTAYSLGHDRVHSPAR